MRARTFGILLEQGVVGAGRGGIEIAAGAGPVGGLDHVGVDENGAEAFHAEAFDKTHAAHVGGEIVNLDGAFADAVAIILIADIQAEVFHAGHREIPLIERFLVHGADAGEAFFLEVPGEVAGDEATGAGDDDQVIFFEGGVFFDQSFGFVHRSGLGCG